MRLRPSSLPVQYQHLLHDMKHVSDVKGGSDVSRTLLHPSDGFLNFPSESQAVSLLLLCEHRAPTFCGPPISFGWSDVDRSTDAFRTHNRSCYRISLSELDLRASASAYIAISKESIVRPDHASQTAVNVLERAARHFRKRLPKSGCQLFR